MHEDAKKIFKQLFLNTDNKFIQAFAYFNCAIAHAFCVQDDDAIKYYKITYGILNQLRNEWIMPQSRDYLTYLIIKTTLNLGHAHYRIKKIDDAKRHFEEVRLLIEFYKRDFEHTPYDDLIKQIEEHAIYGLGLVDEVTMNNAEYLPAKVEALESAKLKFRYILQHNFNHTGAQRHLNYLTVRENKLTSANSPKRRKIEPEQSQNISNPEVGQTNSRFSPHSTLLVTDFFSHNSAKSKEEESIHSTDHQIPVERQKDIC